MTINIGIFTNGFISRAGLLCCSSILLSIVGVFARYESIRGADGGSSEAQRIAYLETLGELIEEARRCGPVLAAGDINTSIRWRRAGGESHIGRYLFPPLECTIIGAEDASDPADALDPVPQGNNEALNRDLAVEMCLRSGCVIANTFFNKPQSRKATYHAWGEFPKANTTLYNTTWTTRCTESSSWS